VVFEEARRGRPGLRASASTTNGPMPLTVSFAANASAGAAPLRDAQWTFEDGEFATNANPVKTFVRRARITRG